MRFLLSLTALLLLAGLARQSPASVVASLFHFTPREYLQVNEQKTEIPSMKI